jgi:hypothetical protein
VRGMRLERVPEPAAPAVAVVDALTALLLLALALAGGAWNGWRTGPSTLRSAPPTALPHLRAA